MISKLKRFIRKVALPSLESQKNLGTRVEGNYKTWDDAVLQSEGYDSIKILEKVTHALRKVNRGEAVFERDSVLFSEIQYSWPVTAVLMYAAALNQGQLKVLDFGGSLGTSYFQNRKFLVGLHKLSWAVVEQSDFVERGRKEFSSDVLSFYETIDQVGQVQKTDVVLLSGVLQYLRCPMETVERLAELNPKFIVLDRTPFSVSGIERIVVQHVSPEIYSASYPCRFFSMHEFLTRMEALNYKVLESFKGFDSFSNEAVWQGFIFERIGEV